MSIGSKGVDGGVGHRPAGAAQGRLLAPLAVLLGRAPVDVVAVAGVHAAHVDALDGAGLRALEAGLALQRAGLVVEQQEAAAMARRDRVDLFRVLHGRLEAQHVAEGEGHALDDARGPGTEAHRAHLGDDAGSASAVTKRLASEAGRSHFQAKPMSWSMRTRGSVPRIHTKTTTKTYVLPRNQSRPITASKLKAAQMRTAPPTRALKHRKPIDQGLPEAQLRERASRRAAPAARS